MEARRRAPHRPGHRTTLRVPDAVMQAARELAGEAGTTPNDAIVQLAEEGLAAVERRRHIERIARERRDAVARVGFPDALAFPTPEELAAAMRAGREES